MFIIEMCGLPGSGKSTVIAAVSDALQQQGYRVADRNAIYYLGCRSRRKGIAAWKMVFKFRHYGLYRKIIAVNRNHAKGLVSLRYAFRLMFFFSQLEEAEKKARFDVALMDEGLAQYTSALADQSAITDSAETEPLLSVMDHTLPRRWVVYCKVSVAEAAKRIQSRSAVARRFNPGLGVEELEKRLRDRETSLNAVCCHGSSLVLDMEQPIHASEEKLMSFVRQVALEE